MDGRRAGGTGPRRRLRRATAVSGGSGGGGGGKSITIYSSLPLQGAARPQSAKLVNGIKLALDQAGGKAGDFKVTYKSLDDSTPQAGTWTPEATSANARKAAGDKSAVAYIGEFNSGATAVSLPLLNDGGMAMVSPANSAVGLTQSGPGAEPGEPDKYYPTGERTFARIVPTDLMQGAGMAQLMKDRGCTDGVDLQRQGGLRRRPGQEHPPRRRLDRAEGRGRRGVRLQGPELPLAGGEDELGGRRLLRLRRQHGQQRRAAVQGRRRRQPGHEGAARLGRGRRARVHRHQGGRPAGRRRQARDRARGRPRAEGLPAPRGSASSTSTSRSSATRSRASTRSTATRRCRCCSTRSSARAATATSGTRSSSRCSRPATATA